MKNAIYVVVMFFAVAMVTGCSKKKDESMTMEGLNGVVSENVVSVDAAAAGTAMQGAADAVPVVVDNAQMVAPDAAASALDAGAAAIKPTAKQIQQALKNAGIYSGRVDGEIGPKTKKAIEAFQSQNGLKADGKVGAKTWKILSSYLNRTTEVANPTDVIQTVGQ